MKLLLLFITLTTQPMTPPILTELPHHNTPYSSPPVYSLIAEMLDSESDSLSESDINEVEELENLVKHDGPRTDGPSAMPVIQLIEIMQKMAYLTGCSNPDC